MKKKFAHQGHLQRQLHREDRRRRGCDDDKLAANSPGPIIAPATKKAKKKGKGRSL